MIAWCHKSGCLARATHHLFFQAWPADQLYDVRTCMNGILPLPLCLDCAKSAEAAMGLFDARTWKMVLDEFKRRRQSPPTFATVKLFARPGAPAAPEPLPVKH